VQGLRIVALDHGPHVLKNYVAALALGEAVARLLADDLVLTWIQDMRLGVGHLDGLHRHLGFVEEGRTRTVGEVAAGLAPCVRGDLLFGLGRGRRRQLLAEPRCICCGSGVAAKRSLL